MTSQLVVGAWVSPVVLAVLAARVATGDAGVPMLLATVVCAPLLALLLAQRQAQHPSGWAVIDSRAPGLAPARSSVVLRSGVVLRGVAIFVGLVLVLAANLIVVGDLARLLGLTRVHGVGAGTVVAVAVIAWPAGDRWWRLAMPIGAGLVLLPLALVVASTQSPRATWSTMAMRPALAFDARSAWVTEGRAVGERLTLTFDEPHRLVAPAPATWRVVESDTAPVSIREWRLAAGDALTLRPGDQLALDAGTRVRFEAGRRVPGAPISGAAWADGGRRPMLVTLATSIGLAITLVGGGWALVPATALPVSRVAAIIVPIGLSAFVLGASLWGLYGIAVVPELALTPRALAPPLEVVARITASPWRQALITLLVVGVVGLLVGAMLAWRMRFAEQVHEIGVTAPGSARRPRRGIRRRHRRRAGDGEWRSLAALHVGSRHRRDHGGGPSSRRRWRARRALRGARRRHRLRRRRLLRRPVCGTPGPGGGPARLGRRPHHPRPRLAHPRSAHPRSAHPRLRAHPRFGDTPARAGEAREPAPSNRCAARGPRLQ